MSLFPITSILDDFNRPDEAPPANWTASIPLSLGIVSQELACIFMIGSDVIGYYNVQTYGPDCETYVDMTALPEDGGIFELRARMKADFSGGYYLIVYRDDAGDDVISLYHPSGGLLGSYIITLQVNDSFGLRCMGGYIEAFYKPVGGIWSQVIGVANVLSLGAGYLGVYIQASTARLDNFGGGTLPTHYDSIFTCDVRID